jgi:hypothetical protein
MASESSTVHGSMTLRGRAMANSQAAITHSVQAKECGSTYTMSSGATVATERRVSCSQSGNVARAGT